MIRYNPCDGVKLPAARKPEITPLSVWAVGALVDSAPGWYRAMILLAAASGLRQGELFGLEVEHLDFRRGVVLVQQQIITPDKGDPYLGEPKTHESYREVPVARAAMGALAEHLERYPAKWTEIEDRTDAHRPKVRKAQFVFLNELGSVVGRSGWSHMWQKLRRVANRSLEEQHLKLHARWRKRGCPEGEEPAPQRVPEDATMHDLRHFYTSVLIKHRESVKTVQKRLGHAKPSITLDIYTHLWPHDQDTTRSAVEATLAQVPSMCPKSRPKRNLPRSAA